MKPTTIAAINIETGRAHVKHGQSFENASNDVKLRILVEEVGEIARALQDVENADAYYLKAAPNLTMAELLADRELRARRRDHLRAEVTQVASLAARWLDAMGGES